MPVKRKKRNDSPCYLWYPKDFISSGRVMALTDLEELWYRRALDQSWLHVGLPDDPVEFAGWVGRGCTPESATKIMARFFTERQARYPDKVFNDKQEELRREWKRKSKERSLAGIESGRKRRERRQIADEQMFNEEATNGNYPYPSSSSGFQRLIERAREANQDIDPRIVEIAVLETLVRRKGSANEHKPIKSVKYFQEEIDAYAAGVKKNGMGEEAINAALYSRRRKVGISGNK